MQSGMPRVLGMSLQAGVLILAIWTGPQIGPPARLGGARLRQGGALFAKAAALKARGIVQR